MALDSPLRVELGDLKRVGTVASDTYCNPGARLFFARHQLDWRDFLFNGIDAQALLATGDAMAEAVVAAARARVRDQQQEQDAQS